MGTLGDGGDRGNSARGASGDPLHLVGAGPFAQDVAEWARAAGHRVVAFVELADPDRLPATLDGLPVVAPDGLGADAAAVVATGGPRRARWDKVAGGCTAARIVHPAAHVSPSAVLGAGCVVGPGAVIAAHAVIGEHVLVSRGVLVGHHARIGAFCALLPGANVAGHVVLGDEVVVGMSGVVADRISVGARATVAAGAVVLRDVPAHVRVQGVPAREFSR